MRVWFVAALLFMAVPGQSQLYSGWVDLINDGANDQGGPLVGRDGRTDLRGVDILELPETIRIRMEAGGGFGSVGQFGSGHEAEVSFTLMSPFKSPVIQHDVRIKVTTFGAAWYHDGIEQGEPLDYDETDMPWNFDVALPKDQLMPEDRLRPRDHLMSGVAWLNATTQFGASSDRGPNQGFADALDLAGGLEMAPWDSSRGNAGSLAMDTASHRNSVHIAYIANEPDPGVYHRLVGSSVDTFIGPMLTQDVERFDTHVAVDTDDAGSLHILHPTQAAANASYRYFQLVDGAWQPQELEKPGPGQFAGGSSDRSDIVAGAGRVIAAIPAQGGLHLMERVDDGWEELTAIAGAKWPRLQMDTLGDVWLAFTVDEDLFTIRESQNWSPLPIAEDLTMVEQANQRQRPTYDFALRPDDSPGWIWRGMGDEGDQPVWQYMVIEDNVIKSEVVPFNRNAWHTSLAHDAYGNAHVAIGTSQPANFLLRTIYGHWYRGPDASLDGPVVGTSADGNAAVVGLLDGDAELSVQWWAESPLYEGFAPRYDPDSGLGLGQEANETINTTAEPKPAKKSPAPWVGLIPGFAWLVRRVRREPLLAS